MLKDFVESQNYLECALLGTIFADGSICKARIIKGHKKPAYSNKAAFEVTHTARNLDYLNEVKSLLEMLPSTTCTIKEHSKTIKENSKTGYLKNKYFLFRLSTNSTRFFARIRDKIYFFKEGIRIKKFPKDLMYKMNDLALLLLYLDDGCLRIKYRKDGVTISEARVTFCLNSFTLEELEDFGDFLTQKYGIEYHYYKFTKGMKDNRGYVLWLNSKNTDKFMSIIDKFYDSVPSMKYKFVKYYLS